MAKKSKLKINFDSIIILLIALVSTIIFLINRFIPGLNLYDLFSTPTAQNGSSPFSFSNPLCILKIFTHIFAFRTTASWTVLAMLLLITPEIETNYGTAFTAIMILLSDVFSGVLAACFCTTGMSGAESVLWLMIFLRFFNGLKKNQLSLNSIFLAVILSVIEISGNGSANLIPMFINIAGGLCGSLVSFMTVQKTSKKKASPKKTKADSNTVVWFDNEADSPRFKNNTEYSDDKTEVLGTLEV